MVLRTTNHATATKTPVVQGCPGTRYPACCCGAASSCVARAKNEKAAGGETEKQPVHHHHVTENLLVRTEQYG